MNVLTLKWKWYWNTYEYERVKRVLLELKNDPLRQDLVNLLKNRLKIVVSKRYIIREQLKLKGVIV